MKKVNYSVMFFLFLLPVVSGQSIELFALESGSVTFTGFAYDVDVQGTFYVNNTYGNGLYGLDFSLDAGTLNLTIQTSNPGMSYNPYHDGRLYISQVPPDSVQRINYTIEGFTLNNPLNSTESVFGGLLNLSDSRAYSDVVAKLTKSFYDPFDKIRKLEVFLHNPTPFNYTVNEIFVFRTNGSDPNDIEAQWNLAVPSNLSPGATYYVNLTDTGDNASDGKVYWLTEDITMSEFSFNDSHYTTPSPPAPPGPGGGDDDEPPESESRNYAEAPTIDFSGPVLIDKDLSDRLILPGMIVNVTISIVNSQGASREVLVKDEIPDGFEVEYFTEGTLVGQELMWELELEGGENRTLTYSLRYAGEGRLGSRYIKGAEAIYDQGIAVSPGLLIIEGAIPEKTVYIQKEITYLDNNKVKIVLYVKNIGDATLKDLLIKDLIGTSLFSEISRPPESKGIWLIESLRPGQSWSVSYITKYHKLVDTLPSVYGPARPDTFKTLIINTLITEQVPQPRIHNMEVIGISSILLLSLFWISLHRASRNMPVPTFSYFTEPKKSSSSRFKGIFKEFNGLIHGHFRK